LAQHVTRETPMMYCDHFDTPIGRLLLAAADSGLRHIDFEHGRYPTKLGDDWELRPRAFGEVRAQLAAYFAGKLTAFDLPLAPRGTPFQLAVWKELREIPYGATTSYGEIARRLGLGSASRAVGAANGRNPLPIVVPCHRVIGADGSLTGFGGGLPLKKRLLALEQAGRPFALEA
jgi:methylated-DNA-[protein]-cysteine S-methyltransferase